MISNFYSFYRILHKSRFKRCSIFLSLSLQEPNLLSGNAILNSFCIIVSWLNPALKLKLRYWDLINVESNQIWGRNIKFAVLSMEFRTGFLTKFCEINTHIFQRKNNVLVHYRNEKQDCTISNNLYVHKICE